VKALGMAVVAAVVLTGCGSPLTPNWLIDRVRVLGATVATEGDEGRATPHAGESATINWLLAFPQDAKPSSFIFAACRDGGTLRGMPTCGEAPFARIEGQSAATELPSLRVTVPATYTSADQLLILGQICTDGQAAFDVATGTGSCMGADPGTTVDLTVTIGSPGTDNRSPFFAADAFTFDGQPWTSPSAADPCTDPASPVVAVSGEHHIDVAIPDAAREVYGSSSREAIQLSHLVDAGTLAAQFSFVESDAPPDAHVPLTWTAPAAPAVASFYFIARDGRGAAAWMTRSVCIR